MSIFRQVKDAINFAIFSASPPSWEHNPHQWKVNNPFKLGHALNFCQREIDVMQGSPEKRIDPRSKGKLAELKRKLKSKVSDLRRDQAFARGRSKKELTERIAELKDALREIQVIEKSSTGYFLDIDTRPEFAYNDKTETATIHYDGSLGSLLNELKHAFQYETGKMDFIRISKEYGESEILPGLTYDLTDQIETYKRQYAYDGI